MRIREDISTPAPDPVRILFRCLATIPIHVWAVCFAPDGKSILTGDISSTARVFPVAPTLPDDPERVARWMEVLTGLRLDLARRFVVPLDNATWRATRDRLNRSEGR